MLFVLPYSRLPPVRAVESSPADHQPNVPRVESSAGFLLRWWVPLTAGSLSVIIIGLTLVVVLGNIHGKPSTFAPRPEGVALRMKKGQEALAEGKFRLAVRELTAAQMLRERFPDALPLSDRRQLTQLHRQALLFSDLCSEPLETIAQHAADLTELDAQEWRIQFAERFRGKVIIFEDEIRRDAAGAYQMLGYRLFIRGKAAKIELDDLQLLRALPLEKPQRLLFGVRLTDVRVEAGGLWVVSFVPDSCVLLTDVGAVLACCPIPPKELDEIAQRQSAWIADLP